MSVRHFIHPVSLGVIHIQSAKGGFYRKKFTMEEYIEFLNEHQIVFDEKYLLKNIQSACGRFYRKIIYQSSIR